MRSASVLDRPRTSPRQQSGTLLVLWQHPETREIVPIGRFARERSRYTFEYTVAAGEVDGFRPLPGLDDLRRQYESDRIPAVFDQRVMSSERADYESYLGSFGLTAATPWEQIVESGGNRAGDTLQFMQLPVVADGRACARFLANGIRHIPEASRQLQNWEVRVTREQQEEALQRLERGDRIQLEPEFGNAADPNAVLLVSEGVPLGWVPRAISASIRELLEVHEREAIVHRVNGPSNPVHLRLALDLDTPAPTGFVFDREGRWEPLAQ